ncbi:hypothetical protein C5167_030645 [Papaver somniferum]|nr:hypothetical protein C5167_030645 [Papaver somniferum]
MPSSHPFRRVCLTSYIMDALGPNFGPLSALEAANGVAIVGKSTQNRGAYLHWRVNMSVAILMTIKFKQSLATVDEEVVGKYEYVFLPLFMSPAFAFLKSIHETSATPKLNNPSPGKRSAYPHRTSPSRGEIPDRRSHGSLRKMSRS